MEINVQPDSIQLAQRQTLSVRDGEGYRIVCNAGTVWITQERDARDIVLQAGQSLVFDRAGLALVAALQPAAIRIERLRAERMRSVRGAMRRLIWAAAPSRWASI
jgi:Protein of unknown function (DUF2917)